MKQTTIQLLALLALILPASADGNNPKKEAGPNGGRVITSVDPRAEFFVTEDRKVQITFLGEDGKAIAPADQVVTVTAGSRFAPTTLNFAQSGNALVSEQTLPEGKTFPTVVQIKVTPEAKTVYERFTFDAAECPSCKLPEYACICGH